MRFHSIILWCQISSFTAGLVDFFQWVIVVPQQIVHLARLLQWRLATAGSFRSSFGLRLPWKTNPAVMTFHIFPRDVAVCIIYHLSFIIYPSFHHIKPIKPTKFVEFCSAVAASRRRCTAARTVAKRFQASAQEGSRVAACRKPWKIHLESSGDIWIYLEISGIIWIYLEISGDIWIYLDVWREMPWKWGKQKGKFMRNIMQNRTNMNEE